MSHCLEFNVLFALAAQCRNTMDRAWPSQRQFCGSRASVLKQPDLHMCLGSPRYPSNHQAQLVFVRSFGPFLPRIAAGACEPTQRRSAGPSHIWMRQPTATFAQTCPSTAPATRRSETVLLKFVPQEPNQKLEMVAQGHFCLDLLFRAPAKNCTRGFCRRQRRRRKVSQVGKVVCDLV